MATRGMHRPPRENNVAKRHVNSRAGKSGRTLCYSMNVEDVKNEVETYLKIDVQIVVPACARR